MELIIPYLINIIQYQNKQICWLLHFICKYLPLKQWAFDDSHSPKYQKFKVDELPKVIHHEVWDYRSFMDYLKQRYGKIIKPVKHRGHCDIPHDCLCPKCHAPHEYLYRNNGSKGQLLCKVCGNRFSPKDNRFEHQYSLRCPHCSRSLVKKKARKHFNLFKCVNPKCSYYLRNLKQVEKEHLKQDYGKNLYKLHYL